jgi:hypothetical protein
MIAKSADSFPVPALNLTNAELIDHINNEFPNLSGSLLMMFNRFRGLNSGVDYVGELDCMCPTRTKGDVVSCPKCGSKLEISF